MLTWREFLVVLAVAIVYGGIRLLPRLLTGRDAWVSPRQVRLEMDDDDAPLLLDVRSPAEYAGQPGHIRGAINLPLPLLKSRLSDGSFRREYPAPVIVAVCRSDARAAFSLRMLKKAGFDGPRVMSGGMSAWEDEGYPVVRGTGADG